METALYRVMSGAVQKTLRGIGRDFREIERLQISFKGASDFVTEADLRTERILKEELAKARPAFGFITEESDPVVGKDPDHHWIIDPIDGTTNFIHGIPHFGICIALRHKDEIIAAFTYDPMKNEEFFAEKGRGFYLNRARVNVSRQKDMRRALLGTGFPFHGCEGHERTLREAARFMPLTAGLRRNGAAALDMAYVACGRFDAYWEHNGLNIWDIAGGLLMVREAGGTVTDVNGGLNIPENGVLASNGKLHPEMLEHLKQCAEA